MKTASQIELMAPAGSYESLRAAIAAGCDSVYFGVTQLNMRAVAASNFDLNDLEEIAKICRENKVKAYLTVNTILYNHDLILMKKILNAAKENKVDAVIVADFAAIEYAKLIGQPMHISTMMSISNYDAVKFFSQYADVVVMARELTLPMIKKIHETIIEEDLRGPGGESVKIEAFVHGALCIAVSGRCLMSLYNHNSSAARGACRQECRKEYRIIDNESGTEMMIRGSHVLSPADLCTIDIVDQLVDSGISVFKFEGRGRPPEYVDTVIRSYKEALLAVEDGSFNKKLAAELRGELEKVYNRKFSHGYLFAQNSKFWAETGHNQSKEERVQAGKVIHYFSKAGVAEVKLEASDINIGDKLIITGKTTGLIRLDLNEMRDEKEKEIQTGIKGSIVTIKTPELVRRGDRVYLLKAR